LACSVGAAMAAAAAAAAGTGCSPALQARTAASERPPHKSSTACLRPSRPAAASLVCPCGPSCLGQGM
jgi:hypothetical protein